MEWPAHLSLVGGGGVSFLKWFFFKKKNKNESRHLSKKRIIAKNDPYKHLKKL